MLLNSATTGIADSETRRLPNAEVRFVGRLSYGCAQKRARNSDQVLNPQHGISVDLFCLKLVNPATSERDNALNFLGN